MACETACKTGMVMVFGEITTKANVDYEAIVRKVCKEIGFTSEDVGLDADKCKVGSARKREQRRRERPASNCARGGVLNVSDTTYFTHSGPGAHRAAVA